MTMENTWQIQTIGNICSKITDGSHNPPKGLSEVSPYRMISSQNVFDDSFEFSNVRYLSENDYIQENKRTSLQKGDVLLTIVGSIGRCAIITSDEHIVLQRSVAVLRPKENVLSRYLMYALIGCRSRLKQEGHGIAQKGIYLKQLSNFSIPIPTTVEEQQRIVDELDLLSRVIELKNAQLRILDELAQSIFYEMFGEPDDSPYDIAPLSQLSRFKLSYGSGASAVDYNGSIRYVRITDIRDDGTLTNTPMSPDSFDEKYLLHKGDVLFARSGATVGKTYLYKEADGEAIFAGYLIRFIPDEKVVLPEYVYHFTRSQYYKAFVRSNAQAVAQPNINAQQYGGLKICVPPMPLQKAFAEKINSIHCQKEIIALSIKSAQDLLASRMDKYFNE